MATMTDTTTARVDAAEDFLESLIDSEGMLTIRGYMPIENVAVGIVAAADAVDPLRRTHYTKFPSRDDVAAALDSLPNAGALDEALVLIVAAAYVDGGLVLVGGGK